MNVFSRLLIVAVITHNLLFSTIASADGNVGSPGAPDDSETTTEVCNDKGECDDQMPAEAAFVIQILKALTDELQKPHPFGENNEITKAIREINKFANEGLGENNDIRKFLDESGISDLLTRLGIKL